MIIDKIEAYWTREEKRKIRELEKEKRELQPTISFTEPEESFTKKLDRYNYINETIDNISFQVEKRYAEDRKAKGLQEDIEEIVANITREDYLVNVKAWAKILADEESKPEMARLLKGEDLKLLRDRATESHDGCYDFIFSKVRAQVMALLRAGVDVDRAVNVIETRISLFGYGTQHYIHQGTATNALTKVKPISGKKPNTIIDRITGDATINNGNIMLLINNYAQLTDLSTPVYQLFDALVYILTDSGAKSETVRMSVDYFMELRGLKDRKEAKKQMATCADLLFKTALTWQEKIGDKLVPYAGVNIADSWMWADKKKTAIDFTFGSTFLKVMRNYPVMYYPPQLWLLNSKKNPNSYYLLRKISEHKNMNVGKNNENIIAVKTLLANAPNLPSYEEVMETKGKQLTQRIIEPFQRDMDALADTLEWEYCHSNEKPLKQDELDNLNYEIFITLMVKTNWKYYPDQTARLERKAERQEKAKATRKRATKKKTETT